MKKILLLLIIAVPNFIWAQCTTTNATDCDCKDGSTDCDLLPDITASYDLLAEPDETVEEEGLLYLSVGTPNVGHGPLRVLPTDYYVCGGDTIYSPGGLDACDDGSVPSQIIDQRIYHKNGSDMTFYDRNAGTMTYHSTHGHFHTDNWGVYTLRSPVDGEDDPTAWPIIGYGTKMGFCLMDYASCATPANYGYCRKDDGTVLTNDAPNFGLGAGGFGYSCDIDNQGISCGKLDIYEYYLDGMVIEIPAGVCNGDYYIVVEIDPNGNYLEESDGNNVISVPITLTEQAEDIDFIPLSIVGGLLTAPGSISVCPSETVILEASPVGIGYTWSNGATTPTITVSETGDYYCYVERYCGPFYTDTIHVEVLNAEPPVVPAIDEICTGTSATLTATAAGTINWYDAAIGGSYLGTGASFTTPALFENTIYYAENMNEIAIDIDTYVGEPDHEGGAYSTDLEYNGYQIFDALSDFTLQSVKVFTDYAGLRRIELRDASDAVLDYVDVDLSTGTTVVDLNFDVPVGANYHLGSNADVNQTTFAHDGPRLKRSDEGTDYPYNISGIVSVTGTSFDLSRWYYFYDFHVIANDGINCASTREDVTVNVKVCTSIGDFSAINTLDIYPNPSDGIFNLDLNSENISLLNITITNITGDKVYHDNKNNLIGNSTFQINLSDLAKGIYQITMVADGKSMSRNIVIE